MNRQQRRANGIKSGVKTYTLTDVQIAEIKTSTAKEAIEAAFIAMMSLPLIVLHDKFGFGKQRLEKFEEALKDTFGCFDEGRIDLETLRAVIKEETGMDVMRQ